MKNPGKFYSSLWWRRVRLRILNRDGFCQRCLSLGKTQPAVDIDHKVPWQRTGQFFVADKDLQGLCRSCHSLKTAAERRDKTRAARIEKQTEAIWL